MSCSRRRTGRPVSKQQIVQSCSVPHQPYPPPVTLPRISLHRPCFSCAGEPLYKVFASARKLASIAALEQDGIATVQLDVTKTDSITNAVAHVLKAAGSSLYRQSVVLAFTLMP